VTTSTTYLSNTPQTFPVPFIGGLSVTFRLGATNSLEEGAIVKRVTALHVAVEKILPASVSTQIAILRKLLLAEEGTEGRKWFVKAAKVRSDPREFIPLLTRRPQGEIPLIIGVLSADIMATLVELKVEVEKKKGSKMRMSFVGGLEAHLIAKELGDFIFISGGASIPQQNVNITGEHEIGVILDPPRPFPIMWSGRRV